MVVGVLFGKEHVPDVLGVRSFCGVIKHGVVPHKAERALLDLITLDYVQFHKLF